MKIVLVTASVEGPVEIVLTERGYGAVLRRKPHDPHRSLTRIITAAAGQHYIACLAAALTVPLPTNSEDWVAMPQPSS